MFQYSDLGTPNNVVNFLAIPSSINLDIFRISKFEIILMVLVVFIFIALPFYQQWSHIRKNVRSLFSSSSS